MAAPEYVTRSYGGGAVVAQLQESMGSTDTSFAITPVTGWVDANNNALGTAGPFTVVIDRFTASVEKILCSAINLTTGVVTVYTSGGFSGRGYDGSTAQGHVPGGSTSGVQTCWSAEEAMEANIVVHDIRGAGATSGQLLTWGASAPQWASVTGLQSVSLFGVGPSAEVGGSPPPRLTGAFLLQAGFTNVTFASGFAAWTFPQAFTTGTQSITVQAFNNNPSNPIILNYYSASGSGCELVASISGSPYSGAIDFSYFVVGW